MAAQQRNAVPLRRRRPELHAGDLTADRPGGGVESASARTSAWLASASGRPQVGLRNARRRSLEAVRSVTGDEDPDYRGSSAVRRQFAPLSGHDRIVQDIREADVGLDTGLAGQRHRKRQRVADRAGNTAAQPPGAPAAERKQGVRFARHEHHEPDHAEHHSMPSAVASAPPSKLPPRPVSLEIQAQEVEDGLRRRDLHVAIASLCGLMTMVSSSIVTWLTNPPRPNDRQWNDLDPSDAGKVVCGVLNWCTTLSTVLSILFLCRYYKLKLHKKRREWGQPMADWQPLLSLKDQKLTYSFWGSEMSFWWFLECFIHLVHPLPWMDGTGVYVSIRTKTIYSYFQLWMLLRLYLLGRLLHTIHPAYRRRFEILENNEELSRMNYKVTWGLTMKLYLFDHVNRAIFLALVILFLVFGFALFVIERVEQPLHFGELDIVLFHCFTTSTTIGYGRVKAISKMGRLMTALLGTYGQVVLTFFGAVITNVMEPTKEERIIQEYVESSAAEHAYRVASAMLIQSAWRSSVRYRYRKGLLDDAAKSEYEARLERQRTDERRKRDEEARRQLEICDKSDTSCDSIVVAGSVAGSLGGSSSSPSRVTGSRSDGASAFSGQDRRKSAVGDHHEMMALLDHTRNIGTGGRRGSTARRGDGRHLPRVTLRDVDASAGLGSPGRTRHQHGSSRQTAFQRDIAVVDRLKKKATDALTGAPGIFRRSEVIGGSRKTQLGGGEVPLRGVERDDLPNEEYSTATRRQRACVRFAPGHKSNILFEALKRFRARKRDLQQSRMESSDSVLDKELQDCGAQMIELEDFLRENEEDLELMRDRTLRQLEAIRSGVIARYGDGRDG
eukprot:TRINITY_DN15973_c0_g2_i1.p1 TRINITY_DN15973_c0_g2~~TRINITY_DN15973_c0_g2_i1.p1  ORF type:complete len:855 (+),score=304.83 TRINITY_DN15973_c0_g2_i1:45-2567(+)